MFCITIPFYRCNKKGSRKLRAFLRSHKQNWSQIPWVPCPVPAHIVLLYFPKKNVLYFHLDWSWRGGFFIRVPGQQLALFFEANPHTPQSGKYLSDDKECRGLATPVPKTQALAREPGYEVCGFSPTIMKHHFLELCFNYYYNYWLCSLWGGRGTNCKASFLFLSFFCFSFSF